VIKARLTLLQNQSSKKIKTVRTDNGREYVNENLGSYLREQGIKHEHSMPYTPQQNGVAERLNRTLLERARPMLSEAGLPLDMWGEVIRTANYSSGQKFGQLKCRRRIVTGPDPTTPRYEVHQPVVVR
jgi:transposase InsO family protein